MSNKLKYIGRDDNLKKRISNIYTNYNKIKNYSDNNLSFYQKKEERIYRNKRVNFFKYTDKINEKMGKRWAKYPLYFRKIIDYKYNYLPITNIVSGLNNKDIDDISEGEITPYCYNDNYVCPFWRNDYSNGIVYCDAYNTFNSEIDNSKIAYINAIKKFKTFSKLKVINTSMALFDMVDICNFKWEQLKHD